MLQAERHKKILELLASQQVVKTSELSDYFNLSRQTIHNDIDVMESKGLLQKVHGGAVSNKVAIEPEAHQRKQHFPKEKDAIARQAAQFVKEGETLFIDMGTTTAAMVPYLSAFNQLTIITNNVQVAIDLREKAAFTVILLGGNLRVKEMSTSGLDTVLALKKYYADRCFLGASGVSADQGFTDYHLDENQVRRQMIANAEHNYVLCDHSKLNQHTLEQFAPLSAIETLIVDACPDANLKKVLLDQGLNLIETSPEVSP
ncbi:DeoR/GlpR family DNA-binding transcription regulator [Aerococcus sanguinicola]|uniref:DeoR/GlpR family DNA-binding transcription regulator n=1 Tax=Aerococcus sanguinicola TaxID=119206 RepID=UPI00254AFC0F|nr:DeoR/GlpR family DNA-binding transcription regulator [Aerococcus sanguinicola]MDK7050659.1 DeoR/GlpR family DNA-binding transcription regulator [Aerococcus sanguinicola]